MCTSRIDIDGRTQTIHTRSLCDTDGHLVDLGRFVFIAHSFNSSPYSPCHCTLSSMIVDLQRTTMKTICSSCRTATPLILLDDDLPSTRHSGTQLQRQRRRRKFREETARVCLSWAICLSDYLKDLHELGPWNIRTVTSQTFSASGRVQLILCMIERCQYEDHS
ncbi:hypothetical protein ARMGADRAFT_351915 [Armillaria gallica]|uniref:Uncharacterized protein n=1 Tax=Armillaria gallica TaxID=47427 RepID=A0A2H3DLI4_ARMGA|nr:hypothetical protein ARMGADRAFT_351915 [Armillaria gallica]